MGKRRSLKAREKSYLDVQPSSKVVVLVRAIKEGFTPGLLLLFSMYVHAYYTCSMEQADVVVESLEEKRLKKSLSFPAKAERGVYPKKERKSVLGLQVGLSSSFPFPFSTKCFPSAHAGKLYLRARARSRECALSSFLAKL